MESVSHERRDLYALSLGPSSPSVTRTWPMTGDGFPCRSTSSPGRQARSYTASKAGKFPRYVPLQMVRWALSWER